VSTTDVHMSISIIFFHTYLEIQKIYINYAYWKMIYPFNIS